MKFPSWITLRFLNTIVIERISNINALKCGKEKRLVDQEFNVGKRYADLTVAIIATEEHIMDFGTAHWRILSDARESDR